MRSRVASPSVALAIVLGLGTVGLADQPQLTESANETIVEVTGPLIIGFFPPVSQPEIDPGPGRSEGIAHVHFALEDVAKCLQDRNVAIRMEFTRTLVLKIDDHKQTIDLPSEWPDAVGAYLVRPGSAPRAVYATAGPSSLQMLLPDAAAEYFDAPGCRFER